MWLSDRLYQQLIANGEVKIKINSSSLNLKLEREGTYPIILNQKSVQIPAIYAKDSRKGTWVFHKDADNPLLVEYISTNFHQSLRSVVTSSNNQLRWIREFPQVK